MANKEMKTIQFPNSETVYEIVDNAAREALAGKQPAGNYATTEALNAHTSNTNNPHNVTKSQVGLENVANERQYSSQNPPPYPVSSVAGKTGIVTLNKSDVQLGNVDNTADMAKPVSTAQAEAINAKYTKPASGIPETDLAEEVKSKINNALQKAPNLLKNNVSITYTSAQSMIETGYSLGLVVGQKYNVVYTDNGIEKTATGKAVSIEGMLALAGENYSDEAQEWINIDDSLFFYGADGINSSYQPADDFLFIVDGSSSTERTIVFKSISEASTVIADKVKNLLKINVNGTAYNYDGSVETEINIETGGGGAIAENLLQSSVTANRQAGVAEGDMVNLGYALGLEEGKMYTVKYKFNGSDIVATAKYEAPLEGTLTGATLALCQSVPYEGEATVMPMLLGVQNYNASAEDFQSAAINYGFLNIVDKHQITDDETYTADENNCSVYLRALETENAQNAVSVEITAIEPFAEVVADKVKNPLTIGNVVFDGSAAKTVELPNCNVVYINGLEYRKIMVISSYQSESMGQVVGGTIDIVYLRDNVNGTLPEVGTYESPASATTKARFERAMAESDLFVCGNNVLEKLEDVSSWLNGASIQY